MSINFDDMVAQLRKSNTQQVQSLSAVADPYVAGIGSGVFGLSNKQIQAIFWAQEITVNWTNTNFISSSGFTNLGFSSSEANALVTITTILVQSVASNPVAQRSDILALAQSSIKTAEGSNNLSWFYDTVGAMMVADELISFITPYRHAIIYEPSNISSDILTLTPPSASVINFLRSDVFLNGVLNSDNIETKVWNQLSISQETADLKAVLEGVDGWPGQGLTTANFIIQVNGFSGADANTANMINSYTQILGVDYDALAWMYKGPETAVAASMLVGDTILQQTILTSLNLTAKNTSIVSYSEIETSLNTTLNLETNFSAALTMLTVFSKINLHTPNTISRSFAVEYLKKFYGIINFPDFILDGVGVSGGGQLQGALDLGTAFSVAVPEITLSRSEFIALAGIGVTLLTTFVVFNVTSKKAAAGTQATAEALTAVKTIILDVAISGVVLTVLVETALIYSKTGSMGGTIAQIMADGVILFVEVLEDLFSDIWSALKGEWAKFIAGLGAAAGAIATGEAVIGGDLIAGSSEIAAGESEIAAGEIVEGEEEEAGEVIEAFGEVF